MIRISRVLMRFPDRHFHKNFRKRMLSYQKITVIVNCRDRGKEKAHGV